MSDEIVVLRKYGMEVEARFDSSVLEANGIPSTVLVDTAGGAFPSLAVVFPIRLLVRAEDAELALALLDTSEELPDDDEPPTFE